MMPASPNPLSAVPLRLVVSVTDRSILRPPTAPRLPRTPPLSAAVTRQRLANTLTPPSLPTHPPVTVATPHLSPHRASMKIP